MKTVLVTGANGQLGNSLRRLSVNHKDFEFLFTDVAELDICDEKAVNDYFHSHKIDYVMNCAAYTNVNKAEEDEAVSLRINSDAVHNLGLAARVAHARMIHISTDYVFDGTECRPYVETDLPCPVSAYGRTKLEGENALGVTCPESVIIRTAWLYSEYGNNFVKTMLRLAKERDEIRVVFDQVGTPTYAGDLAEAMLSILEQSEQGHYVPGVFHFTDEGVCSWYDFARKAIELANISCRVVPIETKDYPTPAHRPAYSVLNKAKIKSVYHLAIPHWEESLKQMMPLLTNTQQ
jgi:dTDP-4-dehydrorhamnose reductase